MAFGTSALRDATNSDDVIRRVREETGVELRVMPGEEEARLTFLAVRRWFGWSAGRLLAFDVGGGSLEIACGEDEDPEVAESLPLGASRLTRDWLSADPPKRTQLAIVAQVRPGPTRGRRAACLPDGGTAPGRRHVQDASGPWPALPAPRPTARGRTSGASCPGPSSTTWPRRWPGSRRSSGRASRACPWGALPSLGRARSWRPRSSTSSKSTRSEICPWALREGVILRHLDHLRSEL